MKMAPVYTFAAAQCFGIKYHDWPNILVPSSRRIDEFGVDRHIATKELAASVDRWIIENCRKRVVRSAATSCFSVYFESPDEAFAFKMRWG